MKNKKQQNYIGLRRSSFVMGMLLAGSQGVMGDAIRLEDLEEIPRDEWPDLSDPNYYIQGFNGNKGDQDGFDYLSVIDYQKPLGHTSSSQDLLSNLVVNDETYAQYQDRVSQRRWLEQTQSDLSNVCKDCIDASSNWCPSSNNSSGYCCDGSDSLNCPSQGSCSFDFTITDMQYMLCPNEAGCTYSRYLQPKTNGETDLYEMYEGNFVKGDLCNFKIINPVFADFNDVMFMRLEYITRATAVLIKGESLTNPLAMYKLIIGQDYSALKDINFFLLFSATEESSGDFVFRIWFKNTSGNGEQTPTVVTYEEPEYPDEEDPEGTLEPKPDRVVEESSDEEVPINTGGDINPDDSVQETIGGNGGENTVDDDNQETIGNVTDDDDNQETIGNVTDDDNDDSGTTDFPEDPDQPEEPDTGGLDSFTGNDDGNSNSNSGSENQEVIDGNVDGFDPNEEVEVEDEATTETDDGEDQVDQTDITEGDEEENIEDFLDTIGVNPDGSEVEPTEGQIIEGTGETELNQVTEEGVSSSEGGLGGGILAVILILVILVIVAGIWIMLNVVAKQCPNSGIGKKFNGWKEKRALSKEQKELAAKEKYTKKLFSSQLDSDGSNGDIIMQSGTRNATQSDMAKAAGMQNKVYPATDVEEGSANGNVNPASDNDGSVDGKKNQAARSRIQLVGADLENTIVSNQHMNTIDLNEQEMKRQKFQNKGAGAFQSQSTVAQPASQSFNMQNAIEAPVANPMMAQMQQMMQMQQMQQQMMQQQTPGQPIDPQQQMMQQMQQQMMMQMMMQQMSGGAMTPQMPGMTPQAPGMMPAMPAMSAMPQAMMPNMPGTASMQSQPNSAHQPTRNVEIQDQPSSFQNSGFQQQTAVPVSAKNSALSAAKPEVLSMQAGTRPPLFNPPNPNATGMNFNSGAYSNRPGSNAGSMMGSNHLQHSHNAPSIGASLIDQEAVSLSQTLQGKKKKKKKAKAKINPNAYMDEQDISGRPQMRQSALANAGASIGHQKATIQSEPQEMAGAAALPDLDIDPLGELSVDDGDNVDWDYKDLAGAKNDNQNYGSIQNNNRPAASGFNINNLNDSDDDDFL